MPHVNNPNLDKLIHNSEAAVTVLDSCAVFFDGLPALIAKAKADAIANGATEAELAPLTDLADTLKVKSDAIAAAIVANTPTP